MLSHNTHKTSIKGNIYASYGRPRKQEHSENEGGFYMCANERENVVEKRRGNGKHQETERTRERMKGEAYCSAKNAWPIKN